MFLIHPYAFLYLSAPVFGFIGMEQQFHRYVTTVSSACNESFPIRKRLFSAVAVRDGR
ncbi:hypothetical protein PRABACTJOHN_03076 [Parabacteroides johnsonii DSM 18315]|uniref:Uncharacterized protein n=1 Tax=Parabacteroides johnsonii DSM 18315 TaxID=537006 RepID=B7BDF4_9BACT|nr:hypothetical protein PRABACTJOHN_03076 [Parabacteroides johnsonii DSM 18315]